MCGVGRRGEGLQPTAHAARRPAGGRPRSPSPRACAPPPHQPLVYLLSSLSDDDLPLSDSGASGEEVHDDAAAEAGYGQPPPSDDDAEYGDADTEGYATTEGYETAGASADLESSHDARADEAAAAAATAAAAARAAADDVAAAVAPAEVASLVGGPFRRVAEMAAPAPAPPPPPSTAPATSAWASGALPWLPRRPAPAAAAEGAAAPPAAAPPAGGLNSLPPRPGAAAPAAPPAAPAAPRAAAGGLGALPPRPAAAAAAEPAAPPAPPAPAPDSPAPRPPPAATALAPPPAAPTPLAPNNDTEAVAAQRAKVRGMIVLLFRLCARLGQSPQAPIVRNTLNKLAMAERVRLPGGGALDVAGAVAAAAAAEAAPGGDGALPLSCTILVLGPAGAGKTALIQALLREPGAPPPPSPPPTDKVAILSGTVAGCAISFIDSPGLLRGASAVGHNARVLRGVRAAQAKHRPSIVLYVDRMDAVTRNGGDAPLHKAVADGLGRAVWFNTILVLTHAAAAPPDGADGPLPPDAFSQNRMHLLQQSVRAAAGDGRLFNPAALVDMHPACQTDENGDALLPSGIPWRPSLILWCLASKLMADAEDVLNVAGAKGGGAAAGAPGGDSAQDRIMAMLRGQKLPPIPHLLSMLNQGKPPVAKPDAERDVLSLAAIKRVKSESRRREEMARRRAALQAKREEARVEGAGAAVPLYADDPPLAPTFDPPAAPHRYRTLDAQGAWITRPFVEPTALDHDDGIDGVQAEKNFMLRRRGAALDGVPARAFGLVQKDRSKCSVQAEAEASLHHGGADGPVTSVGVDAFTHQRDVVYTARCESRASLGARARGAVAVSASRLVDGGGAPTTGPIALGAKLEQRVALGRDLEAGATVGAMTTKTRVGGRETATAGNAEVKLAPGGAGRAQLVAGGSFMRFRKDLALGGNLGAQWYATPETTVASKATLNNKGAGGLTLRVTSHDVPALGLSLLVPVLGSIIARIRGTDDGLA